MKTPDQILKLANYFLCMADKASYQLEQERWESDPKEMDRGLDLSKERQRRWRESKTPEQLRELKQKYRPGEWERKKQLLRENSLDGKLLLLGAQIAYRKKDIKKKNDPLILQNYEEIQKKINDFRFEVNEYLYGIHHANSAFEAKPEQLYKLVTKAQSMISLVSQIGSPTISNTFTDVINKLQEHADTLTQR